MGEGSTVYNHAQNNYFDLIYYGPVLLGSEEQEMQVVWDTGSGTLYVESDLCSSCTSTNKFGVGSSSSFAYTSPQTVITTTYEDGTELYGYTGTDKVCINSSACSATDFKFLVIYDQYNFDRTFFEGIFGMYLGQHSGAETEMYYVPKIFNDGIIGEQTFSWYLGHTDETSFIDFGTPNPAMIGSHAITWVPVEETDTFWGNTVTGVYYGDDAATKYAVTETLGFTDTGSSCIIGPTEDVNAIRANFVNRLTSYATIDGWGEVFLCDYRSLFPSLYFQFGDYWFEVRPEDYIVLITTDNICGFCLDGTTNNRWILGDAFMRGWYSIHDITNKQMGFVPVTVDGVTRDPPVFDDV